MEERGPARRGLTRKSIPTRGRDKDSPLYLPGLRAAYCGSVVTSLAVQLLLQWRIGAANDTSIVEKPMDPMSMICNARGPRTLARR